MYLLFIAFPYKELSEVVSLYHKWSRAARGAQFLRVGKFNPILVQSYPILNLGDIAHKWERNGPVGSLIVI